MTISAVLVTLAVTVVLPALVALITKSMASPFVKQFVTALLAAITGLIVTSTQLDGTAVISEASALLALGTFLAAQASYRGLWRPHAINAKLAPAVGVG